MKLSTAISFPFQHCEAVSTQAAEKNGPRRRLSGWLCSKSPHALACSGLCVFKFYQALLGVPAPLAPGRVIIANGMILSTIYGIVWSLLSLPSAFSFLEFILIRLELLSQTWASRPAAVSFAGFRASLFLILSSRIIHSNASWPSTGFCHYYLLIANSLCPV